MNILKKTNRSENLGPLKKLGQLKRLALAALLLVGVAGGQAWAFPMKPDIKLLLQEAKQPRTNFVPARAGWNGPEESSASPAVNPTYEELRREPSVAQKRAQLASAAMPDWRLCLAIFSLIMMMRAAKGRKSPRKRTATVIAFHGVGSRVSTAMGPAVRLRPVVEGSEAA